LLTENRDHSALIDRDHRRNFAESGDDVRPTDVAVTPILTITSIPAHPDHPADDNH
jgi:hypothetical protein